MGKQAVKRKVQSSDCKTLGVTSGPSQLEYGFGTYCSNKVASIGNPKR